MEGEKAEAEASLFYEVGGGEASRGSINRSPLTERRSQLQIWGKKNPARRDLAPASAADTAAPRPLRKVAVANRVPVALR